MSRAWPKSMPQSLDYPNAGIDQLLAGAARSFSDRTAVRDGEEKLTFTELHDQALRVANGLRELGITTGDVVAMHMPNSLWYVVAYYGAICAGATVAPVNPAQPTRALSEQLQDVDARAVVTHPACAAALVDVDAPGVQFTVHVPGTAAAPAPASPPAFGQGGVPLAELLASAPLTGGVTDPEQVAHFQLTGGTTGRSKAVRVLHRNAVAAVLQAACLRSATLPEQDEEGGVSLRPMPEALNAYALPVGDGATIAVAPLFHGMGLITQSVNLVLGQTTVMVAGFNPDAFLADVERYGVTAITGSPAMYYALLASPALDKHDYSRVLMAVSGAAPIDTKALSRLAEVFPNALVCEGYGLTEASMGLAGAPPNPTVATPVGSVGIAVFDTRIEIRSPDAKTVLAAGETGEVWASGPQVADGYHGQPELTAEQFADGWLRTGDMGRLDEHGHLFLVGRAKDMIIYKGYNVYPQPLEEILCSHPAVAQAAVVGAPSESAGEVPAAFVVLRSGVEPGDGFGVELMGYVAERVAPYQKVRELRVTDSLPLTPTGKILKTALRDRLTEGAPAGE
ncbi:class I adenylate-forming enzyme family protein [Streptomyces zaomyceticus]|uniref:class I adenylate-forming enzyme family protein n=1 Tax=Streptomyces zaomyceticus TaxID=68286 RepID=UPI0016758354|nr:class I adenylate-forming enzyme family protein [Streptomyces zaomyceticus]GHG36985.1 long-chain acyl-CoA synthetase [Streptomyces zaomyceticus]